MVFGILGIDRPTTACPVPENWNQRLTSHFASNESRQPGPEDPAVVLPAVKRDRSAARSDSASASSSGGLSSPGLKSGPAKVAPVTSGETRGGRSGSQSRLNLRIEQARWLFALPDGARRLIASGDFQGRTNESLVRWLASDPNLSRRLLRWCNTATFNLSTPFETLEQASQVMAGRDLARLAVMAWVRTLFEPDLRLDIYSRKFLWSHGVAVGSVASMIARTCGVADASDAFAAGVFHDIGLCALERLDPETFQSILGEVDELSPTHEIEKDRLGWTHCDLGEAVLRNWGLPSVVCDAAKHHHDASKTIDLRSGPVVASVAMANYFCSRAGHGSTGSHHIAAPDKPVFQMLGINQSLLTVLWKQVPSSIAMVADVE